MSRNLRILFLTIIVVSIMILNSLVRDYKHQYITKINNQNKTIEKNMININNDEAKEYSFKTKKDIENDTINNKLELVTLSDLGIENNEIHYSIEDIKIANEKISIRGWGMVKGVNNYNISNSIILKYNTIYFIAKTNHFDRKDVTAYFNDGNNYDKAGFNTEFKIDDLVLEDFEIIGIQIILDNKKNFKLNENALPLKQ